MGSVEAEDGAGPSMKQESERQRNENNVLLWWCCALAPRRAAVGCRFLLLVVSAWLSPPECCWAAMFPFLSILVPRRRGRRAHVMSGSTAHISVSLIARMVARFCFSACAPHCWFHSGQTWQASGDGARRFLPVDRGLTRGFFVKAPI